jgi:hypothetical protein
MAPDDADWLGSSLMATRGVGRDRRSETHDLSEEKQGRFHCAMGPYSEPVLHVRPGDRVVVQTRAPSKEGSRRRPTGLHSSSIR